ncbi:helix-turn-helix domain-containing protein [Streptomyces rubiginosohelvolus]|uniref:helix-turn-helix domain-containing protein n=1 Tax=Streptomyces rubiginosohelvolus TaxID=67362 RepID=UPI0033B250D3
MLEIAGLSPDEETVYGLLVASGRASMSDLADRAELTAPRTGEVLQALITKGLASPADSTPHLYMAAAPDAALLPRIRSSADALDIARREAARLMDSYRETMRRRDAGRLLEVITGAEALRHCLRQLQKGAQDEMLWFCKAQYVAMPSGSNRDEFDALARGVRYRVLYEKAFFDADDAVSNVMAGVQAGEIARAVPHLPLRLAVVDRSVAVFPLVSGGPHGSPEEPTTALVRDSNLLAALIALFERYWEDAVPLAIDDPGRLSDDGPHPPDVLSPTDRRLLSLLVAGVSDKTIASQMQLSRRTVQRRIQSMMERSDAATRMQLAWHAARHGWL